MLNFGFRFNWGRPHLTKWFTREREIFIPGYAAILIFWAWFARKNKIRPLYRYEDFHLHDYDKPSNLSHKYLTYIPFNVMNFKISAHYIEINRIFHQEMLKKYMEVRKNVVDEYERASEKEKRTKYALNPNYVYEAFGWELDQQRQYSA
jgi:hypothetical protein